MSKYSIPRESAKAWQDYQRGQGKSNPGLIFDRFALDWSKDATLKKKALEQVSKAAMNADQEILAAWITRWDAGVRHCNAELFTLETDWRLVAGLGRKGALEVGFTFHRYGFPYLPGSSLKGLARVYTLLELADMLGIEKVNRLDEILSIGELDAFKEKFNALQPSASALRQANTMRIVYGTTLRAGQAIFFDAIPQSKPILQLDVMNPHYPDYYQGVKPPADWQSPIPIPFLTVAAGVPFRFAVGWRGLPDYKLQQQVKDWLVNGLAFLGTGGKTSAGYGYFVEPGQEKEVDARTSSMTQPLQAGYTRGRVKNFGLGDNRSYGFITPEDGRSDIFVHISDLREGLDTLETGRMVIYRVEIDRHGKRRAVDVYPEE